MAVAGGLEGAPAMHCQELGSKTSTQPPLPLLQVHSSAYETSGDSCVLVAAESNIGFQIGRGDRPVQVRIIHSLLLPLFSIPWRVSRFVIATTPSNRERRQSHDALMLHIQFDTMPSHYQLLSNSEIAG